MDVDKMRELRLYGDHYDYLKAANEHNKELQERKKETRKTNERMYRQSEYKRFSKYLFSFNGKVIKHYTFVTFDGEMKESIC